jgi:hypothetical protein
MHYKLTPAEANVTEKLKTLLPQKSWRAESHHLIYFIIIVSMVQSNSYLSQLIYYAQTPKGAKMAACDFMNF